MSRNPNVGRGAGGGPADAGPAPARPGPAAPAAAGPNAPAPNDSAGPLLELIGVSKSLGGRLVVGRADLGLLPGRVLALAGPSGVGKSTVLEIMAGLVKPDSGRVAVRFKPALMFQDNALIPWLTAAANLAYAAPGGLTRPEVREGALGWLRRLGLPPDLKPEAMSGGMRRRLGLARTLFSGRRTILLDEPFAFLDDDWRGVVADLVAEAAGRGAAVALTGHGGWGLLESRLGDRLEVVEIPGPPVVIGEAGRPAGGENGRRGGP